MERAALFDVVIVGGGICGLATALALHRKGIRSTVLEKSETLRATGAAIIVQANGWRALDELGVASVLRQTAIQINSGLLVSIHEGKQTDLPIGRGEMRCLRRTDLIKALADNLPEDTVYFGRKVVSIFVDQETSFSALQLQDGSRIIGKVVIGCDGVNSNVGRAIRLKSPKVLSTCAARGFTNYQNGHEFQSQFLVFRNGQVQVGQMPITDKTVYWFVTRKWTPQDPMVSRDPKLIKEITIESLKGFPQQTLEMIKNSDTETLHLTDLSYHAPWDLLRTSFRMGTVTVAGDAMHAMGPFLAQGGSASLEDAVVLARCLAQKVRTNPGVGIGDRPMVEEALCNYVELRKMRVFWLSLQTYLIGTILDTSSMLIKVLNVILLVILFKDPIQHTNYDCRRL